MTAIGVIFAALFGLAFGSFLNVYISRLPHHVSVVHPRSRCPHCDQPIRATDNIPLLSWLLLRGHCRSCAAAIPLRYPVVEASVAALWVACFLIHGYTLRSVGAAVLCWFLVGLCATDAETFLLPDALTWTGLGLGLTYHVANAALWPTATLPDIMLAGARSLASAAVTAALVLLIRWIYFLIRRRTGMGLGDAKLFAMIGAWLGIEQSALVFFLAVVAGAIYGVIRTVSMRGETAPEPAQVPFGSFLCLAALYTLFFGAGTLAWYLRFFA